MSQLKLLVESAKTNKDVIPSLLVKAYAQEKGIVSPTGYAEPSEFIVERAKAAEERFNELCALSSEEISARCASYNQSLQDALDASNSEAVLSFDDCLQLVAEIEKFIDERQGDEELLDKIPEHLIDDVHHELMDALDAVNMQLGRHTRNDGDSPNALETMSDDDWYRTTLADAQAALEAAQRALATELQQVAAINETIDLIRGYKPSEKEF